MTFHLQDNGSIAWLPPSPSPATPTIDITSSNIRQGTQFRVYFKWSVPLVGVLLQSLLRGKERALQTDGGFKAAAWNDALNDVLGAGGEGCTIKSVKNKYQEQRRIWKEWLLHLNVSGWGWDAARGVPVTDEEIMDAYFRKFPIRAPFRYAPPQHKVELEALIGERVARGRFATGVRKGTMSKKRRFSCRSPLRLNLIMRVTARVLLILLLVLPNHSAAQRLRRRINELPARRTTHGRRRLLQGQDSSSTL